MALASGRRAFSHLNSSSYSSATMRALLEGQGLGAAEVGQTVDNMRHFDHLDHFE